MASRVIRREGKIYLWVFDERSDLDADSRDALGRLMTLLPPEVFLPLAAKAGLSAVSHEPRSDVLATLHRGHGIRRRQPIAVELAVRR